MAEKLYIYMYSVWEDDNVNGVTALLAEVIALL